MLVMPQISAITQPVCRCLWCLQMRHLNPIAASCQALPKKRLSTLLPPSIHYLLPLSIRRVQKICHSSGRLLVLRGRPLNHFLYLLSPQCSTKFKNVYLTGWVSATIRMAKGPHYIHVWHHSSFLPWETAGDNSSPYHLCRRPRLIFMFLALVWPNSAHYRKMGCEPKDLVQTYLSCF